MKTGTAKQLGISGQQLAWMRRQGKADIVSRRWPTIWTVDDAPPVTWTVASLLKQLRREAGLTQIALDDHGVRQSSVAAYECGDRHTRTDTLAILLRVYGVTFAEFFARLEGRPRPEALPAKPPRHLSQAIADAIAACYLPWPPRPTNYPGTRWLAEQCRKRNVDLIDFWREVDSRLEAR